MVNQNIGGVMGKRLISLALVIVMLFTFTGCNRAEVPQSGPVTVKLGVIFDFSGEKAEESQQMYNAIEMAVNEINEAGGVLTEKLKIELIKKDDKGIPLEAAGAYYQLQEAGVCAVIGTNTLETYEQIWDISNTVNIPIITPVLTSNELVVAADFSNQSCYSDKYVMEAISYFSESGLNIDKLAVAYFAGDEYSVDCYENFMAAAIADKLNVVCVNELVAEEDLQNFWKAAAEAGAEAVFIPADTGDNVDRILNSARECGYNSIFLGTDKYSEVVENTLGYEIYVPCNMSVTNTNPDIGAFIEKYCSTYSVAADAMCDGIRPAYDAVYFIRDAIEEGYLATAVSVALKLPFLTGSTVLGDYEIGAYGDVKKSVDFELMLNEEISYIGSVFE